MEFAGAKSDISLFDALSKHVNGHSVDLRQYAEI